MKIVHACCRLHNFALKHKIPLGNKPIPIELEVDQEDVLLDNDWRHESHIKEVKEDINVGSFLKERILNTLIENQYSHVRNYIKENRKRNFHGL